MESHELVSIIIPVYNGSAYLEQAIQSALRQSWLAVEVIVVDDGSDDGGATRRIAEKFSTKIRYFHQGNGGVASALNHGISEMRGAYFSWLSHDDLYSPQKIETQMNVVTQYDEPVVVFGDYARIDPNNKYISRVETGNGFDEKKPLWAILEGRINGCTLLVPKVCFEGAGLFDPALPTTQDYDLWYRMAKRYKFVHCAGEHVKHRIHPDQGSRSPRHTHEASLLWMSMLDNLSAEQMRLYEGSEYRFLRRAQKFLEQSRYEGAKSGIMSRLRKAKRSVGLTAVAFQPSDAEGVFRLESGLRQAGLGSTGIALIAGPGIEPDVREWMSADSTFDHTFLCSDHPLADYDLFTEMLRRFDSELFFLTESHCVADHLTVGTERLLENSQIDGMLVEGATGGRFGPLTGAILRRSAMQRALVRMDAGRDFAIALAMDSRLELLSSSDLSPRSTPLGKMLKHEETALPGANANPGRKEPGRFDGITPMRADYFVAKEGRNWPIRLARKGLAKRLIGRTVLRGAKALRNRLPSAEQRFKVDVMVQRIFGVRGHLDGDWYLAKHSDVRAAGQGAGIHFIEHGFREGRKANPRTGPSPMAGPPDRQSTTSLPNGVPLPLNNAAELRGTKTDEHRAKDRSSAVALLTRHFQDGAPVHLLILHALGGGTQTYANMLAKHFKGRVNFLFAFGVNDSQFVISPQLPATDWLEYDLPGMLPEIVSLLQEIRVEHVNILHTIGLKKHIAELLERLDLPCDITFTDYDLVAENPFLISADNEFVSDRSEALSAIASSRHHSLIRKADRRVACSEDLARRLSKLVPDTDFRAALIPEPDSPDRFRVQMPVLSHDEPLRVLVPGALHPHKGEGRVLEAIRAARERNLPICFHLIGRGTLPLEDQDDIRAIHLGELTMDSLVDAVCTVRPHVAWFPFLCPETHSFTLSEAMLVGLPILASDIGAARERLAGRAYSWLMPWTSRGGEWAEALARLHAGDMNFAEKPSADAAPSADARSYYEREYLRTSGNLERAG